MAAGSRDGEAAGQSCGSPSGSRRAIWSLNQGEESGLR